MSDKRFSVVIPFTGLIQYMHWIDYKTVLNI